MPRPGDARFFGSQANAEPQGLGYERRTRDARQRRLEREVFESATRDLTRPLLRPHTGPPLNPDAPHPQPNPHAPNNSGGPIVLPPATFTDDELQEW